MEPEVKVQTVHREPTAEEAAVGNGQSPLKQVHLLTRTGGGGMAGKMVNGLTGTARNTMMRPPAGGGGDRPMMMKTGTGKTGKTGGRKEKAGSVFMTNTGNTALMAELFIAKIPVRRNSSTANLLTTTPMVPPVV